MSTSETLKKGRELFRQKAWSDVGLKNIRIDKSEERLTFHSGKQMWNWVVNSNPIPAMMVEDLTPEQKDKVRQELDLQLRERSGEAGPADLTARVHIGIGTK